MNHYQMLTISSEGRDHSFFTATQEEAYHHAFQSNAMKNELVLWLKVQQPDGEWVVDEQWRPPKEK